MNSNGHSVHFETRTSKVSTLARKLLWEQASLLHESSQYETLTSHLAVWIKTKKKKKKNNNKKIKK